MLYCPKCRSKYEDGTQRFCSNDGGRLLPVTPKDEQNKAGGVFTSILRKMPHKEAGDLRSVASKMIRPKFEQPAKPPEARPHAPISKIYETQRDTEKAPIVFDDDDSLLEIDFDHPLDAPSKPVDMTPDVEWSVPVADVPPPTEPAAAVETHFETEEVVDEPAVAPKPVARLVNPYEIPSGTAEVGDRSTQPIGRSALNWDSPRALVGKTVKGRYMVKDLIGDDEDSLALLAQDQISEGRRVVVRVFMDDEAYEEHFADERLSLSHLKHPNIAAVSDSGELPEGYRFVVSEFVEGQSLAAALRASGQFDPRRVARIIRQTSYALSAAHEAGILHRNLKPDNIMLTVSEAGIEQVKLTNFELSYRFWNESDLVYKSPEEILGETATYASEIYSLAIVAYEMLTARLPFNALSERELVNAQEGGTTVPPSELRTDLPVLADKILEKALKFEPVARYSKARDFGDALFNAVTAVSPWEKTASTDPAAPVSGTVLDQEKPPREFVVVPPIVSRENAPVNGDIRIESAIQSTEPDDETVEIDTLNGDHAWVKRSTEPPGSYNWLWVALPIGTAVILLLGVWGILKLVENRPSGETATEVTEPIQTPKQERILPEEIDKPPEPRNLKPEPGMTRYVNRQESFKGDLARNFLGFEIHYPQEMKRSEDSKNFLDISTRTESGTPIEQLIITRYKSRGSMTLDRPNFKSLSEKSNEQLKTYFQDSFKLAGEGEVTIQSGRWKAYEVRFEGELPDGTHVFGRRFWVPVQSAGVGNGFVITLLATTFANGVEKVDDVGMTGNLRTALEHFEPEPTY